MILHAIACYCIHGTRRFHSVTPSEFSALSRLAHPRIQSAQVTLGTPSWPLLWLPHLSAQWRRRRCHLLEHCHHTSVAADIPTMIWNSPPAGLALVCLHIWFVILFQNMLLVLSRPSYIRFVQVALLASRACQRWYRRAERSRSGYRS